MKSPMIPLYVALLSMFFTNKSSAQDIAKALIVRTSSQNDVNKILETLKEQDLSTYRLTVTKANRDGRVISKTYGTADISSLEKVGGTAKPTIGGINAFEVIVTFKSVKNMREIQENVLSELNRNLTTKRRQTVHINNKQTL